MTEEKRVDLDRTIVRIGGRDATVVELLKIALLVLLAGVCLVVAVAWYRPAWLGVIVFGAAAVGAWMSRASE